MYLGDRLRVYVYAHFLPGNPAGIRAGGKPYYESLAIEETERCKFQQIGVPFEENAPEITKPLPVLHETDTLLAVWLRCPSEKDCNNGPAHTEDSHYVVVQIAKSAFSSTRAYASGTEPQIVPYQPPCKIDTSPASANP